MECDPVKTFSNDLATECVPLEIPFQILSQNILRYLFYYISVFVGPITAWTDGAHHHKVSYNMAMYVQ